ncbi:ATPase [Thermococcus celericrescens]|uniref:ATPase n=1 Tax=Thermococcus celericrescens TaxID=227598 RepID=A0A100XWK4_9EURY|nr:ATP-binding protein [Thermococcus celericrescens]KUH32471.1 ATPase [Thermococcus celericrescens]
MSRLHLGKKGEKAHFFDQRPRKDASNLFGRDEEIEKLSRALESRSWVAVLGPRMVGKTSLAWAGANVFAGKNGYRVVFVDLRDTDTFRGATEKILGRLPKSTLDKLSKHISEVSASALGAGVAVKLKESTSARQALVDAFSTLKDTVLILDEVQNIQQGVPHFLKALGSIFNENDSLLIIFTGSYAGVVRKLFESTHEDPLFGRIPIEIRLSPWSEDVAENFLETGFERLGIGYTRGELREVIRRLGTLPGWLNLYGVRRYIERDHERALRTAMGVAVREAQKELEHLLEGRTPKARAVIKLLAFGATWGELLETGITKGALSHLLTILIDELFIVDKDESGVYYFSDPVYRKAAMGLSILGKDAQR